MPYEPPQVNREELLALYSETLGVKDAVRLELAPVPQPHAQTEYEKKREYAAKHTSFFSECNQIAELIRIKYRTRRIDSLAQLEYHRKCMIARSKYGFSDEVQPPPFMK
jgi:hypothetical protein